MDEHGAHKHETVVNALNKLRAQVKFIPSGKTSFLQPLDVAINSAFKARSKKKWEIWFSNGE